MAETHPPTTLSQRLTGVGIERIPNPSFRLMAALFWLRDLLIPVGRRLDRFGIQPGDAVVDFGCGVGSYIPRASALVGNDGTVYAVDTHPLAIRATYRKVRRHHLINVTLVHTTGYPVAIPDHSVDLIYALDMFHHIADATPFLEELYRLIKPDGTLYIESGHQPMEMAREKIVASRCWTIVDEKERLFCCRPLSAES